MEKLCHHHFIIRFHWLKCQTQAGAPKRLCSSNVWPSSLPPAPHRAPGMRVYSKTWREHAKQPCLNDWCPAIQWLWAIIHYLYIFYIATDNHLELRFFPKSKTLYLEPNGRFSQDPGLEHCHVLSDGVRTWSNPRVLEHPPYLEHHC